MFVSLRNERPGLEGSPTAVCESHTTIDLSQSETWLSVTFGGSDENNNTDTSLRRKID